MNDLTKEIMNDIEQDKIYSFVEDKVMFNAVKKYMLFHLYSQGTAKPGEPISGDKNWALQFGFQAINPNGIPRSNEEIGADLRAFVKGINIVESGFKELAKEQRPIKQEESEINPAL